MGIRSASTSQTFERHQWVSNNGAVQAWVNDIVWKTLVAKGDGLEAPAPGLLGEEATYNLREVILHNRLEGLVLHVWGDKLKPALGAPFYETLDRARRRTELFIQEVAWLLGPKLGAQTVLIDDFAMRAHYALMGGKGANPRFINTLTLWTPTLATREDVIRMLAEGGFEPDPKLREGYVFLKDTDGVAHRIQLCGTIWESAKNWALDVEREVFDRSVLYSTSIPLRLEITDLLLFAMRRFAIDTLAGGGMALRDVVTLLSRSSDELDWDRLKKIKNAFQKPDWFWAALVGAVHYEVKAGCTLDLPEWAREGVVKVDSFWQDFVASRLNWSNPDLRLIDFTRAYVKAAKGT